MPQSGFTVKVLLNDSVAMAIPPIFKFIKGNYSSRHLNNTIKAIKPSTHRIESKIILTITEKDDRCCMNEKETQYGKVIRR